MRCMTVQLRFLVCLMCPSSAGCSTDIASSKLEVLDGEDAPEDSAVHVMFMQRPVGNTGLCTMALVGPDLALTAPHCISPVVREGSTPCEGTSRYAGVLETPLYSSDEAEISSMSRVFLLTIGLFLAVRRPMRATTTSRSCSSPSRSIGIRCRYPSIARPT